MLSVYTRHYSPCTSDDINYKRAAARSGSMEFLGRTGAYFALACLRMEMKLIFDPTISSAILVFAF